MRIPFGKLVLALFLFPTLALAKISVLPTGTTENLNSVFGSELDVWMVGGSAVLRWDGDQLRKIKVESWYPGGGSCGSDPTIPPYFRGIWVNSANDVWIGCDHQSDDTGVLHWNGSEFKYLPLQDNRNVNVFWSTGPNDVWGVASAFYGDFDGGPGFAASYSGHFDGQSWLKTGGIGVVNSIWASSDGQAWATCNANSICHGRLPDLREIQYSGNTELYGLWGSGPGDIWNVGKSGLILHFDGHKWAQVFAGVTTADLYGVWGANPSNVWAVGSHGTVLHFDGKIWTKISVPTTESLHSVWRDSDGEVLVVGDHGALIRIEGFYEYDNHIMTCRGFNGPGPNGLPVKWSDVNQKAGTDDFYMTLSFGDGKPTQTIPMKYVSSAQGMNSRDSTELYEVGGCKVGFTWPVRKPQEGFITCGDNMGADCINVDE